MLKTIPNVYDDGQIFIKSLLDELNKEKKYFSKQIISFLIQNLIQKNDKKQIKSTLKQLLLLNTILSKSLVKIEEEFSESNDPLENILFYM